MGEEFLAKSEMNITPKGITLSHTTSDPDSDKRHQNTIRFGIFLFALCFLGWIFREPIGECISDSSGGSDS